MAKPTYQRRPSSGSADRDDQPQRDPFRCCADGCFMRGTMFVEQMGIHEFSRGLCYWHARGRTMGRDDRDVTARMRKYADLINEFFRLRDAQLDNVNGYYRPMMTDMTQPNHPLIRMPYPERMPVKPDEHHHEWIERARKYMVTLVVEKAGERPEPGRLQSYIHGSTRHDSIAGDAA